MFYLQYSQQIIKNIFNVNLRVLNKIKNQDAKYKIVDFVKLETMQNAKLVKIIISQRLEQDFANHVLINAKYATLHLYVFNVKLDMAQKI